MIEVRDLFKYYGERRAIGPLSFSIDQGEIVGLLGLNGAGKTTALRILACDLLPSSGQVLVDGFDVVDQPEQVRRRVGYLPDTPPLYAEMTVHEYLVFAARLRGVARAAASRHAEDAEALTQLRAVVGDPIGSLSHGYKQRVGIAQALVHRPRLLLLDEPILGLDPMQIVEMRNMLRSLRGDFTIVLSSHNLQEISETCDRILVIGQGQIVASGSEAELSSRMLRGMRFELTIAGDLGHAREVASALAGVDSVESMAASEPGESVHTLRISGNKDIRAELVKTMVAAGIAVLSLTRGERELESIFIRLAGDKECGDPDTPAAEPPAETVSQGQQPEEA